MIYVLLVTGCLHEYVKVILNTLKFDFIKIPEGPPVKFNHGFQMCHLIICIYRPGANDGIEGVKCGKIKILVGASQK